jgi:hypothetical protein
VKAVELQRVILIPGFTVFGKMNNRIISTLAFSAPLIPFITMMVLTDYYNWNGSTTAQAEIGKIIPIHLIYARGGYEKTVYVTSFEAMCLHATYIFTAIGAAIFFCCVIAVVIKNKRDSGDW